MLSSPSTKEDWSNLTKLQKQELMELKIDVGLKLRGANKNKMAPDFVEISLTFKFTQKIEGGRKE